MFGKKKTAAAPKPLSETTNTDESVHVFDQTNGVMKKFEAYSSSHDTSVTAEERIANAGAIGGISGGMM